MLNSEELKEYKKKWREENKERLKEKDKLRYQENKEHLKEYQKKYKEENKEKVKNNRKRYYEENKESFKEKFKIYSENNKESINEYKNKWTEENKEHLKTYRKIYYKNKTEVTKIKHSERMKNDPLYALRISLRKNILKTFRNRGFEKPNKTTEILGCSFEEFKEHLEKQFEPWMNWNNRGKYNGTPNYGWDIDHIIPVSKGITENDIIKLNHHTNLKPLCSFNNRHIKKDNIIE